MADRKNTPRIETDASLHAERENTDNQLARSVTAADADADAVLALARERADRLLATARAAADARLPLSAQTAAAVALLFAQRGEEDLTLAGERERADAALDRERRERREKLSTLLVLERQTTDLHLAIERTSADNAILARDDFLAQASHDVRGLLAAQKLYLGVLAKDVAGVEHAARLEAHVCALVKIDAQMDRLIGDLVDIVAIEAGRLAISVRPHSAAELLSSAAALFEPVARERGQSLSATATSDVTVAADGVRAVQVLGNLLSNAIKFTPRHGQIRAGFEPTDAEVEFFVADTGPGVPAEQADHIFERFVGSQSSTAGLGLGLFIARRLVDAQGGRVWFDRDVSSGAVFRFTLPRLAS